MLFDWFWLEFRLPEKCLCRLIVDNFIRFYSVYKRLLNCGRLLHLVAHLHPHLLECFCNFLMNWVFSGQREFSQLRGSLVFIFGFFPQRHKFKLNGRVKVGDHCGGSQALYGLLVLLRNVV